MNRIYHITTKNNWEKALEEGCYRADSLITEGFIHCSTINQFVDVANARFRNQHNLVLLEIIPEKVLHKIVYENLEGGSKLFPHIYGPLNCGAVGDVYKFDCEPSGVFLMPPVLIK